MGTTKCPSPLACGCMFLNLFNLHLLLVIFGIKYVGKDNANHLLDALCHDYSVEIDLNGILYCGITLD